MADNADLKPLDQFPFEFYGSTLILLAKSDGGKRLEGRNSCRFRFLAR